MTLSQLVVLALSRALGLRIGGWANWLAVGLVAACGLHALIPWRKSAAENGEATRGRALVGIPLVLSLDNLVAGVGLGSSRLSSLLVGATMGAASAVLSLVGLRLGRTILRRLPFEPEHVGGLALLVLAVVLAIDNA